MPTALSLYPSQTHHGATRRSQKGAGGIPIPDRSGQDLSIALEEPQRSLGGTQSCIAYGTSPYCSLERVTSRPPRRAKIQDGIYCHGNFMAKRSVHEQKVLLEEHVDLPHSAMRSSMM
jgi:hypothetical protein